MIDWKLVHEQMTTRVKLVELGTTLDKRIEALETFANSQSPPAHHIVVINGCPKCGSLEIEEQTSGWWPGPGDHSHNPNRHTCLGCQHSWFLTCPVQPCDIDRRKTFVGAVAPGTDV